MDFGRKIHKQKIASLAVESSLSERLNEPTELSGLVLRIRRMAWGAFIVVSLPRHCVQCVAEQGSVDLDLSTVGEGDCVLLKGVMVAAKIKDVTIFPRNAELRVESIEIVSKSHAVPPLDLSKKTLDAHLDTKLDTRPISLRHPRERAIFKIAEGVCKGFRDALQNRGFTEIQSPKIVSAGAEGGAGVFSLDYFGKKAFLAQSPQFYKQIGVGVFGRVFEIGPVFRAEKHQTSRHVNEYTSLDYEMGPISSQEDVMGVEIDVLSHICGVIREEYALEVEMLGAKIPEVPEEFPCLTLLEAHEVASSRLGRDTTAEPDLSPDEEREICNWAQENLDSEFVFITHFPSKKRPFYAMDDPTDQDAALSFDLLFRGLEITTGGQRIHSYEEQVEKLERFGLNPDDFDSFLIMHKHGMMPHGGLGMGMERLVARLLGLANVKEATLFPRDVRRLTP